MSIRPILTSEALQLRRVAKTTDEAFLRTAEFRELVQDMRETLADAGGIGLAAPQIAESIRVILFDVRASDTRFGEEIQPLLDTICINPVVMVTDTTLDGYWEGCLSVPGYMGYVTRPRGIQMSYLDESGNPATHSFEGFMATVCQHEMDHLDGILYIDRVNRRSELIRQDEIAERK